MKPNSCRGGRIILFLFLLFGIAFFAFSLNAQKSDTEKSPLKKDELKTIIVDDYYPYTYINKDGQPDGFTIDLAKAVTQVMGMELTITAGNWDHARTALEKGEIHLLPMMAYSKERDKTFDFTVPHTIAFDALFKRTGTQGVDSIEDLPGKKIIVMKNDQAHDFLLSTLKIDAVNIIPVDNLPQALRLLASGKGDVALMPKLVGLMVSMDLNLTNIDKNPPVVKGYNRPFSFTVKDGDQLLLERLNQGLNIVKNSGRYQEIYEKWFGAFEPKELSLKSMLTYVAAVFIILFTIGLGLALWSFSLKKQVAARTKKLKEEVEERKQTEIRFRQVTEAIREVFWLVSMDWKEVHYISPAYEEVWGKSCEELYKNPMSWFESLVEEDQSSIMSCISEAIKGDIKEVKFPDYRVRRGDGSIAWISARAFPVIDSSGKLYRWAGIAEEITDHKQAEEALRESEERFRAAFDSAQDCVLIWDKDYNYLYANQAAIDHVGTTPDKVIGKNIRDGLGHVPDFMRLWMSRVDRVFETGNRLRVQDKQEMQGRLYYTDSILSPIRDNMGNVISVCVVYRDVTELKKAEDALRKEKEFTEAALNSQRDTFFLFEVATGKAVRWNQAFNDITGYTDEEIAELPAPDTYYSPEDLKRAAAFIKEVLETRTGKIELELICKDGRKVPTEYNVSVVDDEMGTPKYIISSGRDVTERNQAEEALRESEMAVRRKLDAIIEPEGDLSSLELSDVIDAEALQSMMDDFYKLTNTAMAILDRQGKVLVATGWQDICTKFHRVHPETCRYCLESDTQLSSGVAPGEYKLYRCKNNLLDVATPILLGDQHIGNVFIGQFFLKDEVPDSEIFKQQAHQYGFDEREYLEALDRVPRISEEAIETTMDFFTKLANFLSSLSHGNLKLARTLMEMERLQEQLFQARKMEAVGTLAGGIAHDFNNLLQVIYGYTQFMLMDRNEDDEDHAKLKAIQEAGDRGAKLVRQLLLFSRKAETEEKPVDLNHEVEHVRGMLERTIPRMVAIDLCLGKDLWKINADPIQMEQVLLNLSANAADAMPDGGRLVIETENIILDEEYTSHHLDVKPGRYVLLTVSDTGHGMDNETVEHIFEPFFTTKEVGKGTGLGLASVYGIVKSHRGYVNCYSEVGRGTTFKIYMPAMEENVAHEITANAAKAPEGGTETIMLVDDEDAIRDYAQQALSNFGYTVVTAASGEEALDIYSIKSNNIHLVIMDIGMPGMGGYKCLREIKRQNPSAKVLITSGYAINSQVQDSLEAGATGYLGKPYRIFDLLEKVRTTLDDIN